MIIDEKIKELEEKQAEILKEIEELKKGQETFKRYRAEKDKYYRSINFDGNIIYIKEINAASDNYRYITGNYFETTEEAEIHIQNLITYQQLKDIALRLNNGQDINQGDYYKDKYYIYYDKEKEEFLLDFDCTAQSLNVVYCLDENFLNVALSEIGEEKLKQLLKWGI